MPRMRARPRILTSLLIVVAFVGASELVVRAAAGRLRDPLLWPDWEAQNKVAMMDLLRDRGGASVVFVGSSMINAAADPDLITQRLHLRRPVFNAALNGSGMRAFELWTRKVVVPKLRPKVVVLGFNSEALNDHGLQQETFYGKMIGSPLGGGLDGRGSVLDQLESWLVSRSYLVRYRSELRRPRDALIGEDRGKTTSRVNRLGRLDAIKAFQSRRYSPGRDRQVAAWDKVFFDYTPGGRQLETLDLLVRDLTAHGIRVVIARMPVTADATALHPRGVEDQERFDRVLEDFVAGHQVEFFDAGKAVGTSTDLFVDPFHLNTEGSRRFSIEVAEFLRGMAS